MNTRFWTIITKSANYFAEKGDVVTSLKYADVQFVDCETGFNKEGNRHYFVHIGDTVAYFNEDELITVVPQIREFAEKTFDETTQITHL